MVAGWSYIRRDGDSNEELFHIGDDPTEQHNLAADRAARPVLEKMREALRQRTDGPLVPKLSVR